MSNRQKPKQVLPLNQPTFWEGAMTMARRGTAVIAYADTVDPDLIGTRIDVVEVAVNGTNFKRTLLGWTKQGPNIQPGLAYLDNREGKGWFAVTKWRGEPRKAPVFFRIEQGSFRPSVLDQPGRTPRRSERMPLTQNFSAAGSRRS